jgi:hypothetical protein
VLKILAPPLSCLAISKDFLRGLVVELVSCYCYLLSCNLETLLMLFISNFDYDSKFMGASIPTEDLLSRYEALDFGSDNFSEISSI